MSFFRNFLTTSGGAGDVAEEVGRNISLSRVEFEIVLQFISNVFNIFI